MLQQITHALVRPLSLSIQNVNPLRNEFDQISRMILLFVLLLLILWSMGAIELTVTEEIWSRDYTDNRFMCRYQKEEKKIVYKIDRAVKCGR